MESFDIFRNQAAALLPAARGLKDPRMPAVSPLLERHLVSRHTSAYLGVVTAVLHQVSSPAATGAPRDTQRRPGTVPRDVYHHSAILPPKRHHLSGMATSESAATGTDGMYGMYSNSSTDASRVATSVRVTVDEKVFGSAGGGGFGGFLEGYDSLGGPFMYAPFGGSGGSGGLPSLGGSGEYYVPYLDRSYGSHAPLACTVDALARRAEAHKALTRQRLLQQQMEQQMAAGGRRRQQSQRQQQEEQQPQEQKKAQIVLYQPGQNEPYQLRLEGGVQPVALGLAWDTSPGVVAAAAAAAATTAAAIAARAEGLSAAASPLLRDPSASPSLRDIPLSEAGRTSSAPRGATAAASGAGGGGATATAAAASSSPASPLRRRLGGNATEMGQQQTGSGRASPAGAPGSPRKLRPPRTPQSAAEAAAVAAAAEDLARSHLPPAVRRGYNGQLAAQTVKDWETIAEPNRRMMQEIENVTNLVKGRPSRRSSMLVASANGGTAASGGGGRQLSTPSNAPGSASTKRRGGQDGVGADGSGGGGEAGGASAGAPYGKHTSARSRRRYIRYSTDVFPELGLPPASSLSRRTPATANGPFGTAGAAAATAVAGAVPAKTAATAAANGGWGPWEMSPSASAEPVDPYSLDLQPPRGLVDEFTQGEEYGDVEYGTSSHAAKGPRYVLAAAARVPVPIHLHPLPTPPAAVAAVVASGGTAGAAAAALPQWVDPLVAAASGGAAVGEPDSPVLGFQSSASVVPGLLLPSMASGSQSSPYSSRTPSRTTSIMTGALSARGVGLQGCPSGPPLGSPSASLILDEQSGSWSAGGSAGGGGLTSRSASIIRRHAQHHQSGKQLLAAAPGTSGASVDEQLTGSTVTANPSLRSFEDSQSTSPPSSRRGGGDADSATMAVASAAVGRGSPTLEPSLLPLAHGASASTAALQMESSATSQTEAEEAGTAPSLDAGGPFRGLDLDLGPPASRRVAAGEIQRGPVDPRSIALESRVSPLDSHFQAATEEGEGGQGGEEDGEGIYAVAAADLDEGDQEEEEAEEEGAGWSFRDNRLAAVGSASGGMVPAATAAEPSGGSTDSPDWEAGPTPRLMSRISGVVPPLQYSRSSSVTSEAVSASLGGSVTPRSGGSAAAAATGGRISTTVARPGSPLSSEASASAAAAAAGSPPPQQQQRGLRSRDSFTRADVDADAAADISAYPSEDTSPRRAASVAAAAAAPQGPVLTHGTGYRVVTSVAAAVVSEDPREAARQAAQRELEAQLERSSAPEHTAKLKAASRASKALLRAGPQHHNLLPPTLPPLSLPPPGSSGSFGSGGSPPTTGYSIVQPRGSSRLGMPPLEEPQGGGGISVLDATVPGPAEMEAMESAARAALGAPAAAMLQPAQSRFAGQALSSQTGAAPQRRPTLQHLGPQDKDRPHPSTPLGPGSYLHIQATIEPGRTAHMQDVWAI
ncbi:hypothetical protein VOLCADRAFT_104162 [Volvox carteri f. nagariensis]|uniref:Uncharacterized protein n=1 Tax=Volvox carteri f. nagariensis TaxID=3068 RepID=D8TRN8_VOLCA|nr:uncharacterized protein VOLCADRAFT_104162 [Volvox carteri f. nagariensis]EFJ49928.1 hypothetical protein VOLCADRAFT_104162 [Volvox carteri f. nagariensis]|eukprot:XP_002948993.1 hypothetical protein VOLCADRAFT_104162 [Volvox carteri f. nagariensis]